ncbi:MAG: sulfotransferase family 2 domain-containing protein [Pseudomonadota bacterium]
MIINAAHDFGFVHIPKCAGSTIRQQLRGMDDLDERFFRSLEHPDLGKINANHLPLDILDRFYPEDLSALRSVTSYTLVRDPMDRFLSGVAQYVRGGGNDPGERMEPGQMTPQTALRIAGTIMDHMQETQGLTDHRHTLFMRQAAYVRLHGTQVIDHVYPVEAINDLMDRLDHQHGLTLERDQVWNPTVTYRVPAMAGGLKRVKDVARKALPLSAYARMRNLGVKLFTTKGAPALTETLRNDDKVQRFVNSFYAEDAEIYRAAQAAHPAPQAA